MKSHFTFFTFLFFLSPVFLSAQISLSSLNDFQSGTVESWTGYAPNISNVSTGGPAGAGDMYLNVISTGAGAGGKIVFDNTSSTWTGDWTSAGVSYITVSVNNLSGSSIDLRIALDGGGGRYCTTNSYTVASGSGWTGISIPVSATDFTSVGGSSISSTLSAVTKFRILNSSTTSWIGTNSTNTLGIDNIHAANAALPVTLIAFEGHSEGDKTLLSWITATEKNNDKFEVERSRNGRDFTTVGTVKGAGNSMNLNHYSFETPIAGDLIAYYRLKQYDENGVYTFSPVITIKNQKPTTQIGECFPNPSSGNLMIQYAKMNEGDITLQVFNAENKELDARTYAVIKTATDVAFDFSALPQGIYFIKLTTPLHSEFRKFVKQ